METSKCSITIFKCGLKTVVQDTEFFKAEGIQNELENKI
jgi:hypothetical protein